MSYNAEYADKKALKEAAEIWESFEWLYRDKLQQLDHLTRYMLREMSLCNVPLRISRPFVREKFRQLWLDVAREQEEEVGRKQMRPKGA